MAKTALITGASQGIGACIAERLARDGMNIAVNCRGEVEFENGGKQVAAKCREYGVDADCFLCDVTDFDGCGEMVKKVVARFGSLDVLVNNAGITRDGLLVRMSEEQYDAVINVNMKSVFNMTRFAGAQMIRQRGGRIVNVSSVAGLYGNAGQFNYSASKAGIVGMTMTAAKELGGRNITVNAVAPGFINTQMTAVLPDKVKEEALHGIALRRFGEVEEIAAAVSFLVGPDSTYITGQTLVIDGGMVM
ncbi:3-oxoacyl-[acyl-carrier-protein] reductase [Zongyangia hominis]|uniref:3-oxoacyl-[acyl-carrier-protein] reductase n=1 Tax=Zongyangia hominis TaxID=2763677 RepID=A0A926EAK1_9FIRM|nr:3-oxoacyl-[acyl-carrier-protein] reductase [Zongyangia hominis]MBC8570238.1 3-oxoacyl-[acyl-carrier-protein] reductase [Zongyangia hominis]